METERQDSCRESEERSAVGSQIFFRGEQSAATIHLPPECSVVTVIRYTSLSFLCFEQFAVTIHLPPECIVIVVIRSKSLSALFKPAAGAAD